MPPELHSLPLFHRIAGSKVVVVGDGEMAAAKRRLIERAGGICCAENEGTAARLAFVALEDGEAAEAAAKRLRAQGLLVNVADRPELCDFILPSILERGDVLVAVSTGGASAGLAKHLRLRLEAYLPQGLGTLASALAVAREAMRARWADPAQRRRALDTALASGGPLDPLREHRVDAVSRWIESSVTPPSDQTAEIVLVSEDPDDLTLRQARLLGMADSIVHDASISPAILARARADALRVPSLPHMGADKRGLTVVLRRS